MYCILLLKVYVSNGMVSGYLWFPTVYHHYALLCSVKSSQLGSMTALGSVKFKRISSRTLTFQL